MKGKKVTTYLAMGAAVQAVIMSALDNLKAEWEKSGVCEDWIWIFAVAFLALAVCLLYGKVLVGIAKRKK
jgi:hypothetical protein